MDTENKPNNPTAFPTLFYNQTTGEPSGHDAGMTLRDYFANSAMQGIISANTEAFANGMGINFKNLAIESYEIDDAMLKQREL